MNNPWKRYSKINPQRENGHRQISSEVLQALIQQKLSGAEFRVLFAIIDKTWGYDKQFDAIAVGQIKTMCELATRTIHSAIANLKAKRIIACEPSSTRVQYGSPLMNYLFNKHYDTWREQGCKIAQGVQDCSPLKGAESLTLNELLTTKTASNIESNMTKGAESLTLKRVQDCSPTIERKNKERKIKKEKERKDSSSNRFDAFWKVYPKKVAKEVARKAFLKINPSDELLAVMIKALEAQKETEDWKKQKGQFIPHPSTWLNGKRWQDEIEKENGPVFR